MILAIYFVFSLVMMILFGKYPRKNVKDPPTWGIVKDIKIPTINGKKLETWIVYQTEYENEVKNNSKIFKPERTIILAHGNSRNRDRMVKRSKTFFDMGYNTIIFSFRSHGNSEGDWYGASIVQFYQDLKSVIDWWYKPVLVYGHSLGAASGLITAGKSSNIKGLILDASPSEYPYDLKFALRPVFGKLTWIFLPGSKIALRLYNWKYSEDKYNPGYAAQRIKIPVLIFHGVHDHIYPPSCARKLDRYLQNSELHIMEDHNHSSIHEDPAFGTIISKFVISHNL